MFKLYRPKNTSQLVPDFVVENIHGMRKQRKSLGLGYKRLSWLTDCAKTNIIDYELNAVLPMKENYNKLAAFFGWRLWV